METPTRYLINAYSISRELLARTDILEKTLGAVLDRSGFTGKISKNHQFLPEGATAFYFLPYGNDSGHLAFHTWPEDKMYAADLVVPQPDMSLVDSIFCAFASENPLADIAVYSGGSLAAPLADPPTYITIPRKGIKLVTSYPPQNKQKVGREVIADLQAVQNCSPLRSPGQIEDLLDYVCQQAGFHPVSSLTRETDSHLQSAKILTESHLALKYNKDALNAYLDIFTCSREGDPQRGFNILLDILNPKEENHLLLER